MLEITRDRQGFFVIARRGDTVRSKERFPLRAQAEQRLREMIAALPPGTDHLCVSCLLYVATQHRLDRLCWKCRDQKAAAMESLELP